MKTPELYSKSSLLPQVQQANQPFFQKAGGGSFFSSQGAQVGIHFNPVTIQRKESSITDKSGLLSMLVPIINTNGCGCPTFSISQLSRFSKKERAKSHNDEKVNNACQSCMSGNSSMIFVTDAGYIDGSIGSYWFVQRRGVRLVPVTPDSIQAVPPQPNFTPNNRGNWVLQNNKWVWVE